ncbi:kelch repeat-containing protein [Flavivirga aquimarina]|uniref:Kelch repeat-containing protein n=1 Tax=Flavivirga aquimarina TaxID=2027862 RepID=A0ABT8WFK0_9FLAO|nr:kelch repeat-containing protein [Flavivirga aquimarina]MDO5971786.1 kelch repeat-containing protein [Flavivirga aquimarina]
MNTKKNLFRVLNKFILLLLFVTFQQTFSQSSDGNKWQTLNCTGEPVARHEAAFIEVDGKFYLVGGRRIQEVSIFNPKTNTWTSGAKPPIEMHHFQGVSYKGKIYVVGAHTGKYPHETPLTEAYAYDPVNDTWEKSFSMPKNRVRASTTTTVYKNKLYIAGGIIDGHWDGHVKWFDVYDFKTGAWETLPDAPRARDHATSVICNNKLYLLGGRVTSGKTKKVFQLTIPEVDVFDFKTGQWSTLDNPVPTQRAGCMAVCVKDKIVFTGGESSVQKMAHNEVESLDTKTGLWSVLPPLNEGRHGTHIIHYKKKLYIASGCGKRGGNPELTTIECISSNIVE